MLYYCFLLGSFKFSFSFCFDNYLDGGLGGDGGFSPFGPVWVAFWSFGPVGAVGCVGAVGGVSPFGPTCDVFKSSGPVGAVVLVELLTDVWESDVFELFVVWTSGLLFYWTTGWSKLLDWLFSADIRPELTLTIEGTSVKEILLP